MPHSFWYYAIKHSACIMNMIPCNCHGKLASPFMLAHGVRLDQRTWISYSPSAPFIMRKMVMPCIPRTKHTPQMASLLAGLQCLMLSLSTTLATSTTTNQTITHQILFGFPLLCILRLFTIADYLFLCIRMSLLLSANHIRPVLKSKMSTQTLTYYGQRQSWIFLWILLPPHTI